MRIYFDTNVLVSSYLARGICADLYRFAMARYEVLTGEVNLAEIKRVLKGKVRATAGQIAVVEAELRDQTIIPKPAEPFDLPIRDPADRWVLASAVAGQADQLVTGDRDLLTIADQAPLPVLTPRESWEFLRRNA